MENEIELALAETLVRLRDALELTTGLTSRWNGTILWLDEGERSLALFRPDGSIAIQPELPRQKARWRTLLHELVHSLGHPITRQEYDNFRGWEEGVVEAIQRRIRPQVMTIAGFSYDEDHIQKVEIFWPFRTYLNAIEQVRELLQISEEDSLTFYVSLLQRPLSERPIWAMQQVYRMNGRAGLEAMGRLSATLKVNLRFGESTTIEQERLAQEEDDDY